MKRRFEIDAETLPDLPGMMLVTVEALKDLGGSATIQELDEKVIEIEGVTEAEQAFTMPRDENRTRVNYYLAWARTYLKRGGALDNSSRGVWALTENGSGLADLDGTQAIYDQVTQEERERARQKRLAAKLAETHKASEIEVLADNGPEDEEDWKSVLLAVLGKMPPEEVLYLQPAFRAFTSCGEAKRIRLRKYITISKLPISITLQSCLGVQKNVQTRKKQSTNDHGL
jgi:restriction system protein